MKLSIHPYSSTHALPLANPIDQDDLSLQQMLGIAVAKAWKRPFYRQHWQKDNLSAVLDLVQGGNFSELPVIRKSDLRSNFDEIVDFQGAGDLVSSSGTTGRPVDMPVHREQEVGRVLRVRRLLRELGVGPGSRVLQLLSLNDLFTLGVLAWQAIKAEGAIAIRCSPGRLDRILDAIRYNRPEFVIGNPYVMLRLAKEAGDRWPAPEDLPNGAFFAVAATFTPELGLTPVAEKTVEAWGLRRHLNQYGTSELGPVGYETREKQGFRIHDDYHYVELIDPATGKPVEEGQPGEIVVTGLTFPRGFIPIRYATGDVGAWLRRTTTEDGRTATYMGPIIGRTDHQLKILGQTVFPDLLLDLIDRVPGVKRSAVTVKRDALEGDLVTILCCALEGTDSERLQAQLVQQCNRNLAVSPEVKIVEESMLIRLEQAKTSKTNGSKVPRFFEL